MPSFKRRSRKPKIDLLKASQNAARFREIIKLAEGEHDQSLGDQRPLPPFICPEPGACGQTLRNCAGFPPKPPLDPIEVMTGGFYFTVYWA